MVLPAGAHGARAAGVGRARRGVRVAPPGRQLRRLHRGQVLRAHLQRVLPVSTRQGGVWSLSVAPGRDTRSHVQTYLPLAAVLLKDERTLIRIVRTDRVERIEF